MQGPVFNTVNGIFGQRGSGKTVFAKGDPTIPVTGLFNIYVQKQMKVLVLDTFNHPSYRDVPIIPLKNINKGWKKGVYRHVATPEEMYEVLRHIGKNIWNTALFLEDAAKYVPERLRNCKPLFNLIGDSKQLNVDLFFMYHNWAYAPKDLYRYMDYIEVFKTKDSPEDRKKELKGIYSQALDAYHTVMNDPNPYAHVTIDTGA